jgi:hypothetical protein
MSSAYVAALDAELRSRTNPAIEAPDLSERFLQWYEALPEVSRCRPFAMSEIEEQLQTQGRYLSAVLLRLGWTRKRRWTGRAQYNRYWVPPTST